MPIFQRLVGEGGLAHSELRSMTRRSRFSDYLPYVAYDRESKIYLNADNTIGAMWECTPLCFLNEKIISSLEGVLRIIYPEKSILQFILYADKNIEGFVRAHENTVQRDLPLIQKTTEEFRKFCTEGVKGVKNSGGIPLRNYRSFVALKMPVDRSFNAENIICDVNEILKGSLLYPSFMGPEELIDFLRRLINRNTSLNSASWNENIPINKQIIFAETDIKMNMSHIKIGDNFFRCITPKDFPAEVNALQTNNIFGGIQGIVSDNDQYKTPFLYTLNVVFHNLKASLHAKCNLVLQQQAVGSFAPSLRRKQEEYLWATDELEKGSKFVRIIPALWLWAESEDAVSESVVRAKRVWESQGYVMQEDKGILPIMFVSSLPFGLYDVKSNISQLDRDFVAPVDTVAQMLPAQADFAGGGRPVLPFVGRKGQICGIDVFDRQASNHNIFIAAGSGGGKSFLVNYLTYKYFASGAMVRLIDIGGSYKKVTKMFGARFLDFSGESDVCINPFTHILPEEFKNEVSTIASIVLQMIYSATDRIPADTAETAMTLIKAAIKWAWKNEGNDASIDTIYEYLNEFPKHASDYDFDCPDKEKCAENFKILSQTLAFNLSDFIPDGTYGRWFNGRSNFDISSDEFVVLELEHLKPIKELFKVVTLQVINAVTQDLYLSDRSKPRFIVFDESWQFLREGVMLKDVIEEGYRRARKYDGSFSVITQSLLDLKAFGSVGDVIRANSAYKFYLESVDFEKALAENLIDYDDFTMKLLKSLKTNKPKYSEIFMDTPFGVGIARLVVDPYSYYVYTSDAGEITKIEAMLDKGASYEEAVDEMVKRYRS